MAVQTIKDGRNLRFQPFNNYRRKFELEPYKSFEELTGESDTENPRLLASAGVEDPSNVATRAKFAAQRQPCT